MTYEFWMTNADGSPVLDLFGDPIPRSRGKRGRPPHVATAENRHRVTIWLAMAYTEEQIAEALDISPPTLRRHYFSELSGKRTVKMRMKARHMELVFKQAEAGNGAALSLLDKMMQRMDLGTLSDKATRRPNARTELQPAPIGKKAERLDAAKRVGGLYAPRPAPGTPMN